MAFNGATVSCPECGHSHHFGSLEMATKPRLYFACECGAEVSFRNDTPAALDAIDAQLGDLMKSIKKDLIGQN